jgi:PAS domain S-box-containing protein
MSTLFQGYQSLVENSPDAISLINQNGEILYGSASNTKLLGYRPDELLGRDCIELLHPEDRSHSSALLNEVIAQTPGSRTWDARVRRKDGTYCWVESTVSNLIQDKQVQAIVMHQRDIHERRETAAELVRSNLRMEEFAYTVAHDLREPLRAISLYTQMLFARLPMDKEQKEMAQFVLEGANRMSVMVKDLLAFARSGMPSPLLPVRLEDAVAQAVQNLDLEIRENGAQVTAGPLPTLASDEAHLVRVFQNLISNAIKYRSERPLTVEISAERRGPDWCIKVQDNGVGIAPEFQDKIFLPFIRLASRAIPGTGLGLAVCKKAIEGMGGTIWVESEPGVGATFAFTLPAQN